MATLLPRFRRLTPLVLLPMLSGCGMVVLDPAGDVARQQGDLIVISTVLMLLIIVPVMALTIFFAWRYRAANKQATYKPDWDHSTQLELVIWAAPLLIIICLGAVTWVATHLLDPYRPLARTAPGQAVAAEARPLDVQVVALDWKWLFIYPEQGVAAVNELVVPVDRPLRFRISSSSVMNSFYIPALAGQIYAMPGMETKLHGVFNETGSFTGFSANYSGAGFSNMRFAVKSMSQAGFEQWVAEAKRAPGGDLDRLAYLQLEKPSEKEPVRRFAAVEPQLFDAVVNMCVEPGKMCMHDMMSIDAAGGAGIAGIGNVRDLSYDKFAARGSTDIARWSMRYVAALCSSPIMSNDRPDATPVDLAPLTGAGLKRPAAPPPPAQTALNAPAAASRPLS
ncbi:cytochrome o ubiquinol oxidase subunit 2 [Sphingopyxis panaciterrae]|uniref:ubiquinol oxidase subunit II n=1 Tax=Sphingopyxis panaciterrae TaxID=363841 RepID=UPI001421D01B|nr:ubiquinol oxidase subunit II [Sphingopyxis panaciterrae]NIJ35847.1 cytochrome o ubiquinol oxidase subunit 2 [Sphingopyxis panaciterrae]